MSYRFSKIRGQAIKSVPFFISLPMTLADILRTGDQRLRNALLCLLADNNVGANLELVQYSAKFIDREGETISIEDDLFFVDKTFYLDNGNQVECFLIREYGAQRFLSKTVLKNVSSKVVKSPNNPTTATGGGNGALPGNKGSSKPKV